MWTENFLYPQLFEYANVILSWIYLPKYSTWRRIWYFKILKVYNHLKRSSVDAEHLFRFRSQNCVFKFIPHSVDEAWVTKHWDWIDNAGPPSYLLCLFCSQFCLYTSVSLTKSSTLRACHQKKMLSTVQMQDLLPEERKKTFYFCVITLGYVQLNRL